MFFFNIIVYFLIYSFPLFFYISLLQYTPPHTNTFYNFKQKCCLTCYISLSPCTTPHNRCSIIFGFLSPFIGYGNIQIAGIYYKMVHFNDISDKQFMWTLFFLSLLSFIFFSSVNHSFPCSKNESFSFFPFIDLVPKIFGQTHYLPKF